MENTHGERNGDTGSTGEEKRKEHSHGEAHTRSARGGAGEEYKSELTVEVEVEGTGRVSMMEVLKEIRNKCGEVMGCRVKEDKKYEITMKEMKGKKQLIDGLRLRDDIIIQGREIAQDDMVVSFINLPVYLEDNVIYNKLKEWGVTPISTVRRRKWPGTDIADGTRFLKVRFNEAVRSLPYSTKFETLRGAEYFRVIHDRQIKVCRQCIKPGHIFRECPEFRCYKCQRSGHYARECPENAEREEERTRTEEEDRPEREQTEAEECGEQEQTRRDEDEKKTEGGADQTQEGGERAQGAEEQAGGKEERMEEGEACTEENGGSENRGAGTGGGKSRSSGGETAPSGAGDGTDARTAGASGEFCFSDITESEDDKPETIAETRKRPQRRCTKVKTKMRK